MEVYTNFHLHNFGTYVSQMEGALPLSKLCQVYMACSLACWCGTKEAGLLTVGAFRLHSPTHRMVRLPHEQNYLKTSGLPYMKSLFENAKVHGCHYSTQFGVYDQTLRCGTTNRWGRHPFSKFANGAVWLRDDLG